MSCQSKKLVLATLIATLALLSGLGCAKPSAYKAPVIKFRNASVVVIELTKTYLTELNKVERDQYIYTHASVPQQIKLNELEREQVFSRDAIATRLQALDQLSRYTELLYRLATSDSPDSLKSDASDLEASVTQLSTQIAGLTGADDSRFQSAAGKALPIIGDVLKAFAEQSAQTALKKAIAAGADPVNQLLDAIEADATLAYERRRTTYSGARVIVIDQYNREFQRGARADPEKLKAFADAISSQEDRWEAFLTARPTAGLEAMKNANSALVDFAKKPKPSIHDVTTLSDAMDSFATTAAHLGDVAKELKTK